MMLGDILGNSTKCVCGAAAFMDVETSEDNCFISERALGKHYRWHEPRWNEAGNCVAYICQTCLKKENKQVILDKKLGLNGKRQFPEWDDNGKIVVRVR